jgi:hypothetical protein
MIFEVKEEDTLNADLKDVLLIPNQSMEQVTLYVQSIIQDMVGTIISKFSQLVRDPSYGLASVFIQIYYHVLMNKKK